MDPTIPVSHALLESLRDDEPCLLDHRGHCQAHGFILDPGESCPQAQLKALLGGPIPAPDGSLIAGVEVQWCAFYGGPDPDNAAGLEVFTGDDAEACAREDAHWRVATRGIARRRVAHSPWTVQPLSIWSDGQPDERFTQPGGA